MSPDGKKVSTFRNHRYTSSENTLKPIFHQNAKYLASGAGVGQCPRRQHFGVTQRKIYQHVGISGVG